MKLRKLVCGRLGFMKEEGFELSPKEVQTLEDVIRENNYS